MLLSTLQWFAIPSFILQSAKNCTSEVCIIAGYCERKFVLENYCHVCTQIEFSNSSLQKLLLIWLFYNTDLKTHLILSILKSNS